jgi:phosphoribosylformylglycinamidine synthase
VPRGHEKAFLALCVERDVPYTPVGVVDSRSGALDVRGLFRIPLTELREAWSATLPALFGDPPPDDPDAEGADEEPAPAEAEPPSDAGPTSD